MANQNVRKHAFLANGQKAVKTEDRKYLENAQNYQKKALKQSKTTFLSNIAKIAEKRHHVENIVLQYSLNIIDLCVNCKLTDLMSVGLIIMRLAQNK